MTVIAVIMVFVGAVFFAVGYLGQIASDFSKKNKKKSIDKYRELCYTVFRKKEKKIKRKELKKMTTWTVYFGSLYDMDASGKKEGTPEEIQKIVDSWKEFTFVREFKPGVWFVEV